MYYIVPVHIVESGIILDTSVSIQCTPEQYNFVSYNYTKATGANKWNRNWYHSGAPAFTIGFLWGSWIRVITKLPNSVFCRSLFVMLSFFFLPLFCLSFFDVRILIIPLLHANFSPWVTCDVWRFSLSCLARFSLFSPKDLKKSSLL